MNLEPTVRTRIKLCLIHVRVVAETSRKSCKMSPLSPLDIVDLFKQAVVDAMGSVRLTYKDAAFTGTLGHSRALRETYTNK